MKCQVRAVLLAFALLCAASAHASQFATGGEEILLDEGNTPVHLFTESGTLTVTETCFAQLLLVGGGGGGGNDCAAGGGGGGVVEVAAVRLSAGSYAVTVGAGGLGGGDTGKGGNGKGYGSNGGASSIADPSGTVLYTALGGGGGGGWGAVTPTSSSSAPFASGGGGTNGRPGATAGDPTQGNDGGSSSGGGSRPAGGGGAGGTAVPAVITWGKNQTSNGIGSGNGGPGIWSDITGTNQMYGAGGGGGYDGSPGAGGDGIGGHGWRSGTTATGDEPGRTGYGGGGGGGNNNYFAGAAGGSGTVILRLTAATATTPEPVFTWDATTARPDHLVFTFTVMSAGTASTDGTVDVFAEIADAESAWDAATGAFSGTRTALFDDTEIGLLSAKAYGLRPSHGYYVRLVVANGGGEEAVSDIRSLATTALIEERWTLDGRTGSPGLWQLQSGNGNDLNLEIEIDSPAVTIQRGAVAAGVTTYGNSDAIYNGGYVDEEGRPWNIGAGITFRYTGWVFLEADVTYNFFGTYWDAIRFDLDGTKRLNSGQTYSYACAKTGWHKVDLWFGGGGGRLGVCPGWSFGFGWNTNGVTSTSGSPAPGADWIRFENGFGGDEYLRTVPLGRTVDISSWSVDSNAGTATFAAALGESWDDTALYAVWGPGHGGEDTNEWAHVAYVGVVGTAAATASFTVPDISDLTYFRFVAVDDKPLFAWSPGQLVDLSNPAIGIVGIADGGDRATVTIQVDSVGTGTFSLSLLYGQNSDLSGASVTNVPVDGPGTYTVTVPVTPGVANYFRAEATTSDGGADATAIDILTPASASAFDETAFGTSVDRHKVTFTGKLDTLGVGNSVVSLWVGESPDALVEDPDAIVVSHLNRFTIQRVYAGWPKTFYWKLVVSNTGAGGTSWEVDSEVRSFATSEWGVSYTWAAGSTDGCWTNAANWTTSTPGALGYPATNTCTAAFPGGTEATIDVPEGVYYVHFDLNTTGSHVVLRGENAATTGFANGDGGGATMAGTTLVLDNLFLEENDVFDYNLGSTTASQGPVLALENGGVLSLAGYTQGFCGTNTCLSVSEGSILSMGYSPYVRRSRQGFNYRYESRLLLRAAGEAFHVAGRAWIENLYLAPLDGENGLTVRLAGPDAQLTVRNGVLGDYEGYSGYDDSGARPLLYDADIVFEPFSGGYTNTVSYSAGGETVTEAVALVSTADSGRAMGKMLLDDSVGKIRLSVDTASMRGSFKGAKQHFVLWKGGIDTNSVELVQGDKYALSYTYGWPSVNDEPENVDDLPTGVWAEVSGTGGFILIIR